ncbi:MAG: hypothetical protein HUU30_04865 [Burkholderiaceae bacterium]|nr:hypothetical protein [Chloroflexi bacterium CFX7]MCK6565660.1 hypothetical protein [Dehalococcoidia bacterium]NUP85071.1 hypothetical protein [Burkholderiaceae bacterium]
MEGTRAPGAVADAERQVLAHEARRLREEALARYSEVDLLVAALRDHIKDLRLERDRLLTEMARLRDDARRQSSAWLWRGAKENRES